MAYSKEHYLIIRMEKEDPKKLLKSLQFDLDMSPNWMIKAGLENMLAYVKKYLNMSTAERVTEMLYHKADPKSYYDSGVKVFNDKWKYKVNNG